MTPLAYFLGVFCMGYVSCLIHWLVFCWSYFLLRSRYPLPHGDVSLRCAQCDSNVLTQDSRFTDCTSFILPPSHQRGFCIVGPSVLSPSPAASPPPIPPAFKTIWLLGMIKKAVHIITKIPYHIPNEQEQKPSFPGVAFGTEPTTGLLGPTSANLWADTPKRQLPHWPDPKPKKSKSLKPTRYAYVPKPKPKPPQLTTRNPDFDDMFIENYHQQSLPSIQPLQNTNPVPPTPSFNKPPQNISSRTTPSTNPQAYSSEYDSTSGASSKQMDMLLVHDEASMPENHIASFLKTLAMNDRPQVKASKPDLFANFEEVFMAEQHQNPSAPPNPNNDPIVEDPSSTDSSDAEYVLPKPPPGDKYQQFTIDDLPPKEWCDRFGKFAAWLQADLQIHSQSEAFTRFLARLTGRLRDWYLSLGEYRQKILQQQETIDKFLGLMYIEFVGKANRHLEIMREEILNMKCCSLDLKDLEKHYDRLSKRFYVLGGIDDTNLKQIMFHSLPDPLVVEAKKILKIQNREIKDLTLADIYEVFVDSVERMCNQQTFKRNIQKNADRIHSSCNKDWMKIKCKNDKACDCRTHRKGKYSRRTKRSKHKPYDDDKPWKKRSKHRKFKKKSSWKYVKRRNFRKKRSDGCFICHKKGHFAKNCPNAKKKEAFMALLQQYHPDIQESDIESILSAEDEASPETIMQIHYSDDDQLSEPTSETSSYDSSSSTELPMVQSLEECLSLSPQPSPYAKIFLIRKPYAKPVPLTAFFDTGSTKSFMNPAKLPSSYWQKCSPLAFRVANGEILTVDIISKSIQLQIFPGKTIRHKVYGSSLTKR
ncbi:hypothetical protein LguiB_008611 [Lonicera macranthoides]